MGYLTREGKGHFQFVPQVDAASPRALAAEDSGSHRGGSEAEKGEESEKDENNTTH